MPQKVDIHGWAVVPETIVDVELVNRLAIYYPYYEEIAPPIKWLKQDRIRTKFVTMAPYGVQLDIKEHPKLEDYTMITDKGKILQHVTTRVGKKLDDAENMIMHALRIDPSGNQEFNVMFIDRTTRIIKLRDVPAKVRMLSGQIRDVHRNSEEFDFSGGGSEPTTDVPIKALRIQTTNGLHMIFGGFDIPASDILPTYHKLLEMYNSVQANKGQALLEGQGKQRHSFNLSLPKEKLQRVLPTIKIQSPVVLDIKKDQKKTQDQAGNAINHNHGDDTSK